MTIHARMDAISKDYQEFLKTLITKHQMSPEDIYDFAVISFSSFPALLGVDTDGQRIALSSAIFDVRNVEGAGYGDFHPEACIHQKLTNHIESAVLDGGSHCSVEEQIGCLLEAVVCYLMATSEATTAMENARVFAEALVERTKEVIVETSMDAKDPINPTLN